VRLFQRNGINALEHPTPPFTRAGQMVLEKQLQDIIRYTNELENREATMYAVSNRPPLFPSASHPYISSPF
jgi:hypothetical protein